MQVQGKYKEMQELRRQEQSRQQRILKAKEELAAAELDLQNVPAYEPPQDKIVCVLSNFDLLLSSAVPGWMWYKLASWYWLKAVKSIAYN